MTAGACHDLEAHLGHGGSIRPGKPEKFTNRLFGREALPFHQYPAGAAGVVAVLKGILERFAHAPWRLRSLDVAEQGRRSDTQFLQYLPGARIVGRGWVEYTFIAPMKPFPAVMGALASERMGKETTAWLQRGHRASVAASWTMTLARWSMP
ncbi:hypothetical protein AHiyo6_28990 [Arthrobacter sp. Hiyo6]|nr:hypothetical protein AHiyo6_28990 [Arthrobacter sp. Hiyo6]